MFNFISSAYNYLSDVIRLNSGLDLKFPHILYLELTKKCNLRCKFCDIWKAKKGTQDDLTLNELIPLFDEAKQNNVQLVSLSGGEPLLRTDIYQIIAELIKRKLPVSLTTNATLLTKEKVVKLRDAGLRHLTVSLDAPMESVHDELRGRKGTFKRATDGINCIKKLAPNINININMTINRMNYNLITSMLDLCESLKITMLNLLPLHKKYPISMYNKQSKELFFNNKDDSKLLKKEICRFKEKLKKSGVFSLSDKYLSMIPYHHLGSGDSYLCFAGRLFCEIDNTGNVFPCYGHLSIMGNIRKQSLYSIWNSSKTKKIRNGLKKCSSCWESCYAEPSIRLSPLFLLRNPIRLLREYRSIIR